MARPWKSVLIDESGEPLLPIPSALVRLSPHPYMALGAPYGGLDPFWLREGVIDRLISANNELRRVFPKYRLAIFDAWRPIQVQSFMFQHAVRKQFRLYGFDLPVERDSPEHKAIEEEVKRFWAVPSSDLLTPPPHSTGGAVDLTLVDLDGNQLDMGGEIDEVSEISEPNYYASKAQLEPQSEFFHWDNRRRVLATIMSSFDFAQHPNEWWHFSFGDQLWAWSKGVKCAIYGQSKPPEIRSMTN